MHEMDARRDGLLPRAQTLAGLRQALARIAARHGGSVSAEHGKAFALGAPGVDACLGGGLRRAALHEIHAPEGFDWPAAAGFALALAFRAAPRRPALWARQDFLEGEVGRLNGLGLAALGFNPALLSLARGRDAEAVLRAGVEAARCKSLGAALIEIYGDPRVLDLTASLRLARAAESSGVTVFLLRVRAAFDALAGLSPSAAASRWRARAVNSRPLPANAPGSPGFCVTLLRQRNGAANRSWRLEWLRDRGLFHEIGEADNAALSGPIPAFSAGGEVLASRRRAG
jgi:protein ImuA